MLAYNKRSLDNLLIQQQSEKALQRNLLAKEEYDAIAAAHPINLYTPNIFIRIGLFLATAVSALMGFGILMLMFHFDAALNVILPFFSILLYAMLEWIVNKKRHLHSGVDDALLWLSVGFIIATVNYYVPDLSGLAESVLIFILSAFAVVRFSGWLMSVVMLLSIFAMIFYSIVPLGAFAKMILPFVLMVASLAIYVIVKKNKTAASLRHYTSSLLAIEVVSLIGIYVSVNYFVVRELSNALFNLRLAPGASISGGWFFWTATLLIPPTYIFLGLRKKDIVLLRVGLLLLAATIFTFRYYYSAAPIEVVMTIGGAVVMVLMYIVTRYLKTPRHGITSQQNDDPELAALRQVEGLVIAETYHPTAAPAQSDAFQFGGGSSGGGGATGEY